MCLLLVLIEATTRGVGVRFASSGHPTFSVLLIRLVIGLALVMYALVVVGAGVRIFVV